MSAIAPAASAQAYPHKPIRIVTAASGGGLDMAARVIAQGLTAGLGQQAIVENRGGSVVVAAELVANASPDGYTLLSYGSAVWLAPFMGSKLPYDPVQSFAPITLAVSAPNILVVTSALPVNSVRELIAYAKAKPGALSYASAAAGGSSHLAAELFKAMAGVDIVRIAYRGTAPALNAVVPGEVHLMFSATAAAAPLIRAGKLKALAITSAHPSALLPGLPTAAATGLPGFESVSVTGVFAPAGTPAALISRLNREMARTLAQPNVKEKFFAIGAETVGSTPEVLAAAVKSDMAKLGKVIRESGARGD